MNLIVPHKKWSNMLDLQVAKLANNKENLPLIPNPQNKISTP